MQCAAAFLTLLTVLVAGCTGHIDVADSAPAVPPGSPLSASIGITPTSPLPPSAPVQPGTVQGGPLFRTHAEATLQEFPGVVAVADVAPDGPGPWRFDAYVENRGSTPVPYGFTADCGPWWQAMNGPFGNTVLLGPGHPCSGEWVRRELQPGERIPFQAAWNGTYWYDGGSNPWTHGWHGEKQGIFVWTASFPLLRESCTDNFCDRVPRIAVSLVLAHNVPLQEATSPGRARVSSSALPGIQVWGNVTRIGPALYRLEATAENRGDVTYTTDGVEPVCGPWTEDLRSGSGGYWGRTEPKVCLAMWQSRDFPPGARLHFNATWDLQWQSHASWQPVPPGIYLWTLTFNAWSQDQGLGAAFPLVLQVEVA